MNALLSEIDWIAGVTTWAGNSVMDGGGSTSKTFSLQVGAATGTKNQIAVSTVAMDSTNFTVGASYSGSNTIGTEANVTKTSTAGSEKYVATAVNKTTTVTIEGISLKINNQPDETADPTATKAEIATL
jgi:flagellin